MIAGRFCRQIFAAILTVSIAVAWLSWFGFWGSGIPKGFIDGMLLELSIDNAITEGFSSEAYAMGVTLAALVYFCLIYITAVGITVLWDWALKRQ